MLSPRPVPLPGPLVVKKGSNARAITSGGIPTPVSEISKLTNSPPPLSSSAAARGGKAVLKVRTAKHPPDGIASREFIARLITASSSCVLSTSTGHKSGAKSVVTLMSVHVGANGSRQQFYHLVQQIIEVDARHTQWLPP